MNKHSVQTKSDLAQKGLPRFGEAGVISPMVIGGVVVLGIIIFLIASGSLKFSGFIKTNSNKPQDNQAESKATATSTPAPQKKSAVKLNSESFSDTKYGYSISYPEGWKVKEQTTNVTMFKPSETKGADQADALVSVVADNLGDNKEMKLASIADIHKTYLKKQFTSVEIVGEKETKVGGQDGYELEFTGAINTEKMHGKYIVLKGEKYIFVIVGMANTGLWDDEKSNIDASIQTFKIQ